MAHAIVAISVLVASLPWTYSAACNLLRKLRASRCSLSEGRIARRENPSMKFRLISVLMQCFVIYGSM
jgi:hypothetical protein